MFRLSFLKSVATDFLKGLQISIKPSQNSETNRDGARVVPKDRKSRRPLLAHAIKRAQGHDLSNSIERLVSNLTSNIGLSSYLVVCFTERSCKFCESDLPCLALLIEHDEIRAGIQMSHFPTDDF